LCGRLAASQAEVGTSTLTREGADAAVTLIASAPQNPTLSAALTIFAPLEPGTELPRGRRRQDRAYRKREGRRDSGLDCVGVGVGVFVQTELVPRMGEMFGSLAREIGVEAAVLIDLCKLDQLPARLLLERQPLALEVRRLEVLLRADEASSPAAIDIAPAAQPAKAAVRISLRSAAAAVTTTIRLAVEMRSSLAPRTAARSQPAQSM
jgi:hypothetical protein